MKRHLPRTRRTPPAETASAATPSAIDAGPRQAAQRQVLDRVLPAPGVAQRFGALGLGTPGLHVIGAGSFLTHGTDVAQFLDAANLPQATPDPPAWFAVGSRFSAHAGSRGGAATVHLHNYRVTAALNLLAFDDVADLSAHLQGDGGPAVDVNGTAEAQRLLALHPGIHGYWLAADAVRGEQEIILFAAGLGLLAPAFRSQLDSREESRLGDDQDVDRRRRLQAHGETVHSGAINDLGDFETTADVRGTGRRRSQSIGH